jgi:hypothetical protein
MKEKILEQADKYANANWSIMNNPNEHDNAREGFAAGAIKNCTIPDVIKSVCEMCGEEKELQSDNLCKECYDSLPS